MYKLICWLDTPNQRFMRVAFFLFCVTIFLMAVFSRDNPMYEFIVGTTMGLSTTLVATFALLSRKSWQLVLISSAMTFLVGLSMLFAAAMKSVFNEVGVDGLFLFMASGFMTYAFLLLVLDISMRELEKEETTS